MTDLATPVEIESLLKSHEHRRDPYPLYRQLRDAGRAIETSYGGLLLTRHADVMNVLRDPRMSSSNANDPGYAEFRETAEAAGFADLFVQSDHTLLFLDPPDHTRLRRLVSRAFTPRAVESMRPRIRGIVDELLDAALAGPGGFDLIEDLAYLLPVTVISEMLGVPLTDHERLRAWTDVAVRLLDPNSNLDGLADLPDALRGMRSYFDELIERRREMPDNDLLSALIAVEDEGERLTHEELLATVILLYGAGHETTVNLIGNGVVAMLRHPTEWERLIHDPSLAANAVEEALRYDSPVQLTGRTPVEPLQLDGLRLEAGREVITLLGAANRDPAVFADPDRFDVTRGELDHIAFSAGIHFCLGAALARVEGQEAFAALAQRAPGLRLTTVDPPRKETVTLRGFASLPVELGS